MSVTPVQAECAVAVAEVGSFRRAAAKLYLSQPSVSAHVQQLERSLGVTMFDRDAAGARLTEPGERVLPYLRAFLDQREAVLREASRIQGGATSVIRVAGHRTPLVTWLVAALPVLQGALGTVHLETEYVRGNGSARMVDAGEADIGLAINSSETRPNLPNVEMILLKSAPTVVFAPTGHRLARSGEIDAAEMAGETVVSIGGRNGVSHRDVHLAGVEHVRTMSAPDTQAAFEIARSVGGLVLTDAQSAVFADAEWVCLGLRRGIVADYVLCRRRDADHAPAAVALWRLLIARAVADGYGQTVS